MKIKTYRDTFLMFMGYSKDLVTSMRKFIVPMSPSAAGWPLLSCRRFPKFPRAAGGLAEETLGVLVEISEFASTKKLTRCRS